MDLLQACLTSPLPRDEVVRRLKGEVDKPWALFGAKPVTGWVRGGSICLRKRICHLGNIEICSNAFQTYLRGRLSEENGQTRIDCCFSLHPVVFVFALVWFGGAFFGCGLLLVAPLLGLLNVGPSYGLGWVGIILPLAFPTAGAAILGFGRYLARDERRFLTTFLQRTLGATEV